jgi:hypothetical protein
MTVVAFVLQRLHNGCITQNTPLKWIIESVNDRLVISVISIGWQKGPIHEKKM